MNNSGSVDNPPQAAARPPSRPSMGVRYGDMRGQLREAALLRAQRKGQNETVDVQTVSPQMTESST